MNIKHGIAAGCLVWLALSAHLVASPVPEIMELNGTLAWTVTHDEEPVAGVQPFTVRIYNQLTGGTLLWEEHYNVEVDRDGRYSIQLGAGTQGAATNSLSDALAKAGSAAFVEQEVRINGETRVFAPRQAMAVAPFALMAGNATRSSRGFTVHDGLIVAGHTAAHSIDAHTLTNSDSIVSNQVSLSGGTLKCNTMTAQKSDEPVVFSTGIAATKDIRVQGGAQIFSMRKPQLTLSKGLYQADTDCWFFLDPSTLGDDWEDVLYVEVGPYSYEFRGENYYPVPIPKGSSFKVTLRGNTLWLNTDLNNPAVFADSSFPGSYFMCLGVKP